MSVNQSAHILHVENDRDDAFLTQRAFRKVGLTNPINSVDNGEQAVAYLQNIGRFENRTEYPAPAVILLDWNMPLMSGAEFLAWLRAQTTAIKRIPVVVLTSSNNERDVVQAYDLGANGFLVKPRTNEAFQTMALDFGSYWLKWNRTDASKLAID
jgi:CheY-like chemotaxis protein